MASKLLTSEEFAALAHRVADQKSGRTHDTSADEDRIFAELVIRIDRGVIALETIAGCLQEIEMNTRPKQT